MLVRARDLKRNWGGGGGVLPYISHIGECLPKGYAFWAVFGLKTGKHLAHFGLESGMVFG